MKEKELIQAVNDNNIHIVEELLLDNNDIINCQDNDGSTPLYLATSNGYTELVKLLLENGADVNIADKDGNTPVHIATDTEIVELLLGSLLKNQADINKANNNGYTFLHLAIYNSNTEITKLLLENGADVNINDKNGNTSLHYAATKDDIEIVKLLLDRKADINKVNKYYYTPLHIATFNSYTKIVKLLLENGANVNLINKDGYTSLYIASLKKHIDIVKLLLNYGADINKANEDGDTPLSLILSDNELRAWFKEQFNKDNLKEYNNIGKFELARGLFYIKSHEEFQTNDKIKEIANITLVEVAESGFMDSIKGAFEYVKKNIKSRVASLKDMVEILFKIKSDMADDIAEESKVLNDFPDNITSNDIFKLGCSIYLKDAFKDIRNEIISLSVANNYTNRVNILSKLKIMHNLIDQSKVDFKDQIDTGIIKEVYDKLNFYTDYYSKKLHPLAYLRVSAGGEQDEAVLTKLPTEIWYMIFDYLPQKKILDMKIKDLDIINKELSVIGSDISQLQSEDNMYSIKLSGEADL